MNESKIDDIKIVKITRGPSAITPADGTQLYNRINGSLGKSRVVLDFAGVDLVTPAFVRSSLGKLCDKYNAQIISQNLSMKNISKNDFNLILAVVNRISSDPYEIRIAVTND